jgi:hypothetical protein
MRPTLEPPLVDDPGNVESRGLAPSRVDLVELLDRLNASLNANDASAETAWDELAQQRERQLDANTPPAVPLELVIARLEALLFRLKSLSI